MMYGFGMWWLWLTVIGLVVWLVAANTRGGTGAPRTTALELLDERYARGEMDKDEFVARRRDLERS